MTINLIPSTLVPSLEERDFQLLPHGGGAFFLADQTVEGEYHLSFVWAPQADFVERGRAPRARWEWNERVVVGECSGCLNECSRCPFAEDKGALEDEVMEAWLDAPFADLDDVGVVFEGDEIFIVGEELHGFVWEEVWFRAFRRLSLFEFEKWE